MEIIRILKNIIDSDEYPTEETFASAKSAMNQIRGKEYYNMVFRCFVAMEDITEKQGSIYMIKRMATTALDLCEPKRYGQEGATTMVTSN